MDELTRQKIAMPIEPNEQGQLLVPVPRIQYGIGAVLLTLTAVLFAVWTIQDPRGSTAMPPIFRAGASLFCAVFGLGLGWQSLFGQPLTFDAQRKALVRGRKVVAHFDDVTRIEIREKRTPSNDSFWRLVLCLANNRSIDLGTQPSQVEAAIAAAHIATVVGKQVKSIVR